MDRRWATQHLAHRVLLDDGCWEWVGAHDHSGYAQVSAKGGRTTVKVHRLMYELLVGPIPEGMQIDHLCRNRGCVRPDHLEPVSHAENVRRGDAGKHHAAKDSCPNGHPYDDVNTYRRPDRRNRRECRICRNAATSRSRLNKENSVGLDQ
jgi:hypothetical protein